MNRCRKWLLLLLSISVAAGADKKEDKFAPLPASAYPNRQTAEGVTIAAAAYSTPEQTRTAFGKLNPNQYGLLPVLLVIQNDTEKALRLEQMRVEYVTQDRSRIEATPAGEIRYLAGGRRPRNLEAPPMPLPGGPRISRGKNPLEAWEIEGRAWAAKMLPAKESAHGFFYFQTGLRGGAKIYVSGIQEAGTGRELFYFEIPLDAKP